MAWGILRGTSTPPNVMYLLAKEGNTGIHAVTQHTTACCSIQVVDMIFVKGLLHNLPYPSEWYNRNIAGHNTPYFITNIVLTSWYSHRSYENTLRYYLSTITTHNKYKELNNLFR